MLRSTVVAVIRLDRSAGLGPTASTHRPAHATVTTLRMRVRVPPLRIGPPVWTIDHTSTSTSTYGGGGRCPADWADVLEFARLAAMADFDRDRPLWEFTLLDGHGRRRGRVRHKLHHALTDGIGGLQLAALVVDPGPDRRPRSGRARRAGRHRGVRPRGGGAHACRRRARGCRSVPACGGGCRRRWSPGADPLGAIAQPRWGRQLGREIRRPGRRAVLDGPRDAQHASGPRRPSRSRSPGCGPRPSAPARTSTTRSSPR